MNKYFLCQNRDISSQHFFKHWSYFPHIYLWPAELTNLLAPICRVEWPYPLFLLFCNSLSYASVWARMAMRYWEEDVGNKFGWLLKGIYIDLHFPKSFPNLILTEILWGRKIGIIPMVIKRKKIKWEYFYYESFLASEQGKKMFDEKIKAFLTSLFRTVTTCGSWALAMWLILIEMYYCL